MKSVKNHEIWKFALEQAAEEAFKNEVLDTNMLSLTIGNGKDFTNKDAWMENKIMGWIEEVQNKFNSLQLPKVELDLGVVNTACCYYNLKLGEAININKDTCVIRVPGGWMWMSIDRPHNTTFIPYSKEFLFAISRKHSDAL